jgi:hypothetical protein
MTPEKFDYEATPSLVESLNRKELEAHLADTRAKLASNLDALEVKFDIPRQLDKAGRRLRRRVRTMRQDNPIALAGILLGGVAAVGITAYIAVKIATSKK